MLLPDLNLPMSKLGITPLDNYERAREFYEAVKAAAPAGMGTGHLVAPSPPLSGTTPRCREMRAERNTAGIASRRTLARLPQAVLRALIVYSLGWPVFWFAAMDLALFFNQGKSLLGPALDVILMVFGGGLTIVSLIALLAGNRKRNDPITQ